MMLPKKTRKIAGRNENDSSSEDEKARKKPQKCVKCPAEGGSYGISTSIRQMSVRHASLFTREIELGL
jgi:hypothetical protein